MNSIKKIISGGLFRNTAIYGATNAFYTGLPLILMPFLITLMDPEDYGIIELFRTLTLVLTPILGLSTISSIDRFYYDIDYTNFKKLVSTVIGFHTINSVVALGICLFVSSYIDSKYSVIVFLAIITFIFSQITEALLIIYRVKNRPKQYLYIRLGSVVLDLLFLAFFYFLYKTFDWTYRVLPSVISTVLVGLISVALIYKVKRYPLVFDKDLLKKSIWFSAPLIIHMLSGYMLNLGDRFFILYFLGKKELGNYSVAYQIGMAISFFYTSFNLAWTPTFYQWMNEKRYHSIEKVKKIVFFILPVIALILVASWLVVSNFLPNLVKYKVSIGLICTIVVSYVILSYYKFIANYFFYYKRTDKLSIITLISALIAIGLNFILIPAMGIFGAALSTLISFVVMFILVYYFRIKLNEENL